MDIGDGWGYRLGMDLVTDWTGESGDYSGGVCVCVGGGGGGTGRS